MTGEQSPRRPLGASVRKSVWGARSSVIRKSRLREPAIRAYRGLARTVLVGREPRVLANSIPKAGTHLLTSLLANVPSMWYSGLHVIDKDFRSDLREPRDGLGPADVLTFSARMSSVRNGQYATAHVGALPGFAEALHELGFRKILMVRDPRDIVVSMAHYLASNDRLTTFAHFSTLTSEQRLAAAIRGLPGHDEAPPVPSLNDRLDKYVGWLEDPGCLVVRFEDLVGSAGGGSDDAQVAAVASVLRHCERYEDEAQAADVAGATFARHSATFRKGMIGDWRNHLSDGQSEEVMRNVSAFASAFGYR